MTVFRFAKCRFCGRVRSPAEVLEVRDRLTGELFCVCRPGLDETHGRCFQGVGPRARFVITAAVEAVVR